MPPPRRTRRPVHVFRTDDDQPICFMFHKSLNAVKKRELEEKIHANGGLVMETETNVDTIIISAAFDPSRLRRLQTQYACSAYLRRRRIHFELPGFIDTCIAQGTFRHPVPILRQRALGVRPGRRRYNRTRVEFDIVDDHHLARYIAIRRPDWEVGGRCGNEIYKELVQMAPRSGDDLQEYAWVKRHTWHSWRERYVKHKAYFNPIIDEISNNLHPEEMIVDPRDAGFGRRTRLPASDEEEDIEIEFQSDDDFEYAEDPETTRQRTRGRASAHSNGGRSQNAFGGRSSTAGKRRETFDSSPEHGRARESPVLRDKGKGRADPYPVDEESLAQDSGHDSLFDGEIDAVESDIDGELPGWGFFARPTQASQRTLVGTPPRRSKKVASDTQPTTSRNADRTSAAGPSQSIRPNVHDLSEDLDPFLSKKSNQRRSTRKADAASVPRRQEEARKAKRSDFDDPPYRHTRSNSQSAEPFSSRTKTGTRLRKSKATAIPAMLDIIEISDDDMSMPVGETMREEQDVVEHLINVDHSMVMNDVQNEKINAEVHVEGSNIQAQGGLGEQKETSELDSDDQQTRDALTGQSGTANDEGDVFGPTPYVGPRTRANALGNRQDAQVARGAQKSARRGRAPGRRTAPTHNTPVHRQQGRQTGTGVEAVFPSPGTRAYQVKNRLEKQEKSTAYVPPVGTRAAALTQ